ncbi:MAG: transcriptional regulator [Pseudonocardiales bacterium]|nr:transcriptional regulator [Pseudonocardiales bacterium]
MDVATGTPATTALTAAGIAFSLHPYEHDPASRRHGLDAAARLGVDPERLYKTLVATLDGALVCAVVPVSGQLSLKALAATLGGRKAAMAEPAAVQRATGYVLGGVSPFGQRTRLRTAVDESAQLWDTVFVSAGRRGLQVEVAPDALIALTGAVLADLSAP